MAVNSVSSTSQNNNVFLQQQTQATRAIETENDRDKDDVASRAVTQRVDVQKAVEQQVVVEKQDAQRVDTKAEEKIPVVQNATRPTINTSGQVVGSIIDTQA